jgi:molybdopterin molybdotransferase
MISVEQAQTIIKNNTPQLGTAQVAIGHALGCKTKQGIFADRDFPPFDRVTMDGIAVNFDINTKNWPIVGIQMAGQTPLLLADPLAAIEVMTGAMLPIGTDTVIRYEDLDIQIIEGQKQAFLKDPLVEINKGQNVHRQGSDRKKGELLIPSGTVLSSAEIAVAASVGNAILTVEAKPKVAIISTGNELVDIDENPLPFQIRKSNGIMLASALQSDGTQAQMFHLQDDVASMTQAIKSILNQFDVLILSGGVSEGKADFVPQVLEDLGVTKHFHKVAQRPGKPLWFGTSASGKMVFALPGNPVSTFVCYLNYVRTVLISPQASKASKAILATPIVFKPALHYFVPVSIITDNNGSNMAYPLTGNGSGDFANLLEANAFLSLPASQTFFETGQVFDVLWFR